MKALIALIEALTSLVEALTARLAELEHRLKLAECSCEKWRKDHK